MTNLQKFLTNFEDFVQRLKPRGISERQLLIIREKLVKKKSLEEEIKSLRQKRNLFSQEKLKNREEGKEVKNKIVLLEKKFDRLKMKLDELINQLPNLPAFDIPTKKEGNKVVDSINYPHDIRHELVYEKILRKLNLIDEKKSILLSGSKFAVYQNLGSKLLRALVNFMLAENNKKGYQLFDTPYLVKSQNLYHTGQFHKFQDGLYKIEGDNLYLIPTAEVTLVNLYQQQILNEEELPLKICSYSPCFRAERIAAGQESKGLIRLHQFHKVELVKIVNPENSDLELKKLVIDARDILHQLKISHRVLELSQSELGFSAAKTYDIEV
jgi:seryl-tRNA synthetase